MLSYSLGAIRQAATEKPLVIVGQAADKIKEYLGDAAECVIQEPQLGTAHAVLQAESRLRGRTDLVIVAYADMPLLRAEAYGRLVERQGANAGPMSLLTVMARDPRGFGRIVRGVGGQVAAIIEEYVATPEQLEIHELNVGAYCFQSEWLWDALLRIEKNPKKANTISPREWSWLQDGLPVQAICG
jgi:bifunctional UDP-N-acetylglucosamine pyrophosphorylase/glucosamine-1-phosphate N-acetyltransferase